MSDHTENVPDSSSDHCGKLDEQQAAEEEEEDKDSEREDSENEEEDEGEEDEGEEKDALGDEEEDRKGKVEKRKL